MRKVPVFFGELDDRDIEWLVGTGHKEPVRGGACVIEDGKPATSLFIVLQGVFSMTLPGRPGEEGIRLGEGDLIGELAFLDSRKPAGTIRALNESLVFALPHLLLKARLTQDPGLAARFYRGLAVLLAHRVRRLDLGTATLSGLGVDTVINPLDANVLDSVHRAASLFDRLAKRVLAGSARDDFDPPTSTTLISRRRWQE